MKLPFRFRVSKIIRIGCCSIDFFFTRYVGRIEVFKAIGGYKNNGKLWLRGTKGGVLRFY